MILKDLKDAWAAVSDDNIGIVAAGIAHYALLALVPALGAMVLAYGLIADPDTVARHIQLLAQNLPQSASGVIVDQLERITSGEQSAKGAGLLVSLGVALFGARKGAGALLTGLNIAFHAEDDRGFVKSNLAALAITAGGILLLIAIGIASAALAGLPGFLGGLAGLLVTGGAACGAAALLYRYAPNAPAPLWPEVWPGAALFAASWLAASAAFAVYAANFGSYNATYGALGAVVALITWFWATGFLLLLGAEMVTMRTRAR